MGKKIFLYVINVIIFALLILLFISFWASGEILTGFIACAALEFLFLFGSIIVYHLSIISDVMTRQNERAEKTGSSAKTERKIKFIRIPQKKVTAVRGKLSRTAEMFYNLF